MYAQKKQFQQVSCLLLCNVKERDSYPAVFKQPAGLQLADCG